CVGWTSLIARPPRKMVGFCNIGASQNVRGYGNDDVALPINLRWCRKESAENWNQSDQGNAFYTFGLLILADTGSHRRLPVFHARHGVHITLVKRWREITGASIERR